MPGDPRPGGQTPQGPAHQPVLLQEVVRYLEVRRGGVYLDCTVGEGGHASAILRTAMPGGRLLGFDLDPGAREHALRRLHPFQGSFALVAESYTRMGELAASTGFDNPDGILIDLGMSAAQLERSGRGFSFQRDEPLDMRFDPEAALTAADVVNTYSYDELASLLSRYGEEPRARTIARAIVEHRPLGSTAELARLVTEARGRRRGRIHPATRTFQALRIAVNQELESLETVLPQAVAALNPGGRFAVIAFHSLEDRIVKQYFRQLSRAVGPSISLVNKKPATASEEEVLMNPRARSAKLRIVERR